MQTLRLQNVDISGWQTQDGSYGIWLGVGYGQQVMVGSDVTFCPFYYFGQPTDAFACVDSYAKINAQPLPDQFNNVVNINSVSTYNTTTQTGYFEATFSKALQADVNNQDFNMTFGQSFSSIRAHGQVLGA